MTGDCHVRFCKRGKVGNNRIDSNFFASLWSSIFKGFNCSLNKATHELGSKRCKSVWFLSQMSGKIRFLILVWEDQKEKASS